MLSSESGSLRLHVACSENVPRGVALVHKGRWPKLDPGHANVNVLNPGRKTDMGESSPSIPWRWRSWPYEPTRCSGSG